MIKWYALAGLALIAVAGLVVAPVSQADEAEAAAESLTLETMLDRASYAIGVSIGRDIRQQEIGLDPEIIARGIRDVIEENDIALSDEELQQALMAMQEDAIERQMQQFELESQQNLARGQAFLEENREREGVQVTDSGLQYEILEEGDGPIPGPADHVVAHYEGRFVDGEVFDSSIERGQPITLPVGNVIEGWSEALQMMPVGSQWRLFIPADLAYGEEGTGPIGPNQTLIFEVELQQIVGQE